MIGTIVKFKELSIVCLILCCAGTSIRGWTAKQGRTLDR